MIANGELIRDSLAALPQKDSAAALRSNPFRTAIFLIASVVLHPTHADPRIEVAGHGMQDVVLIPEMATDSRTLQPIAEFLARCHRTHSFTLAGFAGQPAVAGSSSQAWLDSIDRYIAGLESRRAIIIGHGFGGILGLRLALDHPEHIDRLIILNALPAPSVQLMPKSDPQSVRSLAEEKRQTVLTQSVTSFRLSQERTLAGATQQAEHVPALVEWALASDRRTLADAQFEWFTTDLRVDIARIRVPTLILVPWDVSHTEDTATTLDLYRKQYASLPEAQVKLIKGSRHYLTFDQPIVTNWAIEEFLGKCPQE